MNESAKENDKNWFQKVEHIFSQVCDLADAQREHRLKELCNDDPKLISEVQSLLGEDDKDFPMMDSKSLLVEVGQDNPIPDYIGAFKIVRVLGEGGMGIVYEAVQDSPKRHIALKVIRQRSMHTKIRKRFEREADILAKLNHPAIAMIYDSGVATHETGSIPFVSMELVIGKPITEHCRDNELDTQHILGLMRDVCRGVAHAHDLGIVHRDLKPSNILVDTQGRVKILDFGIAFDMEIEQRTQMTQTGQLLGTLQYMAPEQIDQRTHTTNKQTDVYALGLICYELLINENPLTKHESSIYGLIRAIRDEEHDLLGTHNRSLRGDIEIIVAKALSKDMSLRYADAGKLADDLDRYATNQPIIARKPNTWYQLCKFSKRNPVLVGSLTMIMIILISAVLLIGNALRIANSEREIARHEQKIQQLINAFVTDDLFAAGNPEFGGDANITLLDAMRKAAQRIDERFIDATEAEASIRFTMGDQFRLMNEYEEALIQLRRGVEISESLDLPIDIVIHRRNSLADVYMDIDDLDTALKVVEKTNRLAQESTDVSSEIMIDTLVQHASLVYHMTDIVGASQYFEQAVEIGRTKAPRYNGTVDAISALATVYTQLKRYEESIKLHHEGIDLRIQTLGHDHPATLVARDNLAILYLVRGQYKLAEQGFREVLKDRHRIFGEDHVKTHLTAASLGKTLAFLDEFEEAENYILSALNGLVETLGADHRYTKIIRSYAFDCYTRWSKPEIAAHYAPL